MVYGVGVEEYCAPLYDAAQWSNMTPTFVFMKSPKLGTYCLYAASMTNYSGIKKFYIKCLYFLLGMIDN